MNTVLRLSNYSHPVLLSRYAKMREVKCGTCAKGKVKPDTSN